MNQYRKRILYNRKKLFNQQLGRCLWCGKRCFLPHHNQLKADENSMATIEHLVPKSQGGTIALYNTAISCFECNNKRSDNAQSVKPHAVVFSLLPKSKREYIYTNVFKKESPPEK